MKVTNLDLMRLSEATDGEFDPADYTVEELEELAGYIESDMSVEELRQRYFEFYDDIKDRTLPHGRWSD